MTFQLNGDDVLLVKVYENRYIVTTRSYILYENGIYPYYHLAGREREMSQPVLIKGVKSGMVLRLDSEMYFDELLPLIIEKFEASASFFGNAKVVLSIEGREVSEEQTSKTLNIIREKTRLRVVAVITEDKAVEKVFDEKLHAASAVEDKELEKKAVKYEAENKKLLEELQELKGPVNGRDAEIHIGSIRSGQSFETSKSLILLGDVKAGAEVTAGGSIFVLGSLHGNANAGAYGDRSAFVMALELNPLQIRIADSLAISEDKGPSSLKGRGLIRSKKKNDFGPEAAEITDGHILIKKYDRSFLENCKFLSQK